MTFYNLYYENNLILEKASESELISFLEDFEIDYGWQIIGELEDNIFFYNQHYHCDKYEVIENL